MAAIVHAANRGGKSRPASSRLCESIYRFDISGMLSEMSASSLDLAVLGLLKEGPMHGYELRKRLTFTLGPLYAVSYGSLYPCLKRLQKDGLVQASGESKPRRRTHAEAERRRSRKVVESKATSSRRKQVYEITPTGEALFFQQLELGAIYDTDRFQTRFAFFRYLPGDDRIRLLEH